MTIAICFGSVKRPSLLIIAHYPSDLSRDSCLFAGIMAEGNALSLAHQRACEVGAHHVVQCLTRATNEALWYAAQAGDNECVRLLLASGASVNFRFGPCGTTPLMEASRCLTGLRDGVPEHAQCVDLLLRAGANPLARDKQTDSALTAAANSGNADILTLLMKFGGRVGDHPGYLLMIAARNGHLSCVDLLISAGACLDMATEGSTALHKASEAGHTAVVASLVKAGANVNQGYVCDFPLLAAIKAGHVDIVEILVKAKAQVNKVYNFEKVPLLEALYLDDDRITQVLLDAGADVNLKMKGGLSLLDEVVKRYGREGRYGDSRRVVLKLLDLRATATRVWFTLHKAFVRVDVEIVTKFLHQPLDVRSISFPRLPECIWDDPDDNDRSRRAWRIQELVVGSGVRVEEPVEGMEEDPFNLQHLCRRSVRAHLLRVSCVNLCLRLPLLPLPKRVIKFLLFGGTLDESTAGESTEDVSSSPNHIEKPEQLPIYE